MRILFLTHYFPPEGNAPASRVHAMTTRWAAAGHEVHVVTGTPNVPNGRPYEGYGNPWLRREIVDQVHVHRVWTYLAPNQGTWRRTLNYLSFMVSGTWRALRVPRPDVVIATSPQFFAGWAGVLTSRMRRKPFVLEIRDIWPESIQAVGALGPKGWLTFLPIKCLELLEKTMYRAARRVVTVGDGYATQLQRRGVPKDKISVVTNGVDDSMFEAAAPDPNLRQLAGASSDQTLIGYIGTVGMAHGLEVILDAARLAREAGEHSLRFVIVGDGARRAELERNLASNDPGTVRFVGLQPKALMPAWLASVDVCLVHLRDQPLFETVLPSKYIEAAAAGKAVILGVRGGIAELARAHGAALPIPPESASALLDAARQLSRSADARAELGYRARELARSRFRVDVLAQDYLDVLGSLSRPTSSMTSPQAGATVRPQPSRSHPSAHDPAGRTSQV